MVQTYASVIRTSYLPSSRAPSCLPRAANRQPGRGTITRTAPAPPSDLIYVCSNSSPVQDPAVALASQEPSRDGAHPPDGREEPEVPPPGHEAPRHRLDDHRHREQRRLPLVLQVEQRVRVLDEDLRLAHLCVVRGAEGGKKASQYRHRISVYVFTVYFVDCIAARLEALNVED